MPAIAHTHTLAHTHTRTHTHTYSIYIYMLVRRKEGLGLLEKKERRMSYNNTTELQDQSIGLAEPRP